MRAPQIVHKASGQELFVGATLPVEARVFNISLTRLTVSFVIDTLEAVVVVDLDRRLFDIKP